MVLPQLSFGVAAAFFLFGWTNPSWTQRKFLHGDNKNRLVLRPRNENIDQLRSFYSAETPMDLLVIGGGSVGTGVALDAALRGLKVSLVEMQDYASGTSSRSTKLIHGGIRYLEKAILNMDLSQLKLVAEALRERRIMIHQAPHLCQLLPTLVPCYDVFELIKFYVGVKLYDLVGAFTRGTLKYSSFVSPYETIRLFPYIRTTSPTNSALLGAIAYYDGQMNDARLCWSVGMTASALGAAVTNYTQIVSAEVVLNKTNEKVVKATILDRISGKEFPVYSRAVVNAGGPFASQIEDLLHGLQGTNHSSRLRLLPSLGTHIVVEPQYCPRDHHAMVTPSSDGRVVFTIPWLRGCLIGTTDIACQVVTDPRPSMNEVQYLLDSVQPYVGTVPKEAVLSSWAGIRPLAAPPLPVQGGEERAQHQTDTQSVVREHFISVDSDRRIVSVCGGKWTTYRKIAEEALDTTIHHFFSGEKEKSLKPCTTEEIVLLGGREFDKVLEPMGETKTNENEQPPGGRVIPDDIRHHLKYTYGDRYFDMLKMFEDDICNSNKGFSKNGAREPMCVGKGGLLCERLVERKERTAKTMETAQSSVHTSHPDASSPVTKGEVIWASRYEHAEHIMDVLARRTRMAFLNAHEAKEAIPKVADLMAEEKGWSKSQKRKEMDLAYAAIESFMVGVPSPQR